MSNGRPFLPNVQIRSSYKVFILEPMCTDVQSLTFKQWNSTHQQHSDKST